MSYFHFIHNKHSGNAPLVVYFESVRPHNEDASEFLWVFGDGDTSTEMYPTHRYECPGTYNVTLIAKFKNRSEKFTKKDCIIILKDDKKVTAKASENCNNERIKSKPKQKPIENVEIRYDTIESKPLVNKTYKINDVHYIQRTNKSIEFDSLKYSGKMPKFSIRFWQKNTEDTIYRIGFSPSVCSLAPCRESKDTIYTNLHALGGCSKVSRSNPYGNLIWYRSFLDTATYSFRKDTLLLVNTHQDTAFFIRSIE